LKTNKADYKCRLKGRFLVVKRRCFEVKVTWPIEGHFENMASCDVLQFTRSHFLEMPFDHYFSISPTEEIDK
jgi:hypothetical protein